MSGPGLGQSTDHGHDHHGHDHGHDQGHERDGDDPSEVAPGEVVSTQALWDERYLSSSALWSGHVNPSLEAEAVDLAPGSALDVGCGEGADAIWLAERGWRVTAVDVSSVALGRGAAHALGLSLEVAQRITWQQEDLTQWVPVARSYDLVSVQFMHLPKDQRELLHQRLAESVAPGGTLLVVGHHPSDLQTAVPRPQVPELLFTAADVATSLAPEEWVILVEEARPRETLDPDGRPTTIHDAVLKATRKS